MNDLHDCIKKEREWLVRYDELSWFQKYCRPMVSSFINAFLLMVIGWFSYKYFFVKLAFIVLVGISFFFLLFVFSFYMPYLRSISARVLIRTAEESRGKS